jgi:hypothetical protein
LASSWRNEGIVVDRTHAAGKSRAAFDVEKLAAESAE